MNPHKLPLVFCRYLFKLKTNQGGVRRGLKILRKELGRDRNEESETNIGSHGPGHPVCGLGLRIDAGIPVPVWRGFFRIELRLVTLVSLAS